MCDLSIIIVNYNVKEYLKNALLSIYEATKNLKKEIFIVDNASTDGSSDFIKENFDDIILIENNSNVGFSKANYLSER